MNWFKAGVFAGLKCALGLHSPDRYAARKVSGEWEALCLGCERRMRKVNGRWRRLRR